jgi:hypothetical protein
MVKRTMRITIAASVLIASVALTLSAHGCAPSEGEGEGEGEEGEGEPQLNPGVELIDTTTVDVEATPLIGFGLAVRPDGRWAVAYAFRSEAPEVECVTFGTNPPSVPQNDILVVDEQPSGEPRTRLVGTVPDQASSTIDLEADPVSGALVVAYMGGAVATGACQASDLIVAVENGDTFTTRTVAANSSDGGSACRDPEDPVCASGDVTGRYPYICFNADAAMGLSYLDTHFGFSNTDLFSSDLEVATGTAGATALATVNDSSGAGNFTSCAVLDDGRVVIGHEVIGSNEFPNPDGSTYEVTKGIYAGVQQADGTFIDAPVYEQASTDSRVSMHTHEGALYLTYHDKDTQQLLMFTSVDDGLTWSSHTIEELARTGTDPTLRSFSDGTLVAAYGHCRDSNDGSTCVQAEDGVRVSTRRPQDDYFKLQTFTGDDEDRDGAAVDAVMLPDDTLVVSSVSFPVGNDGQPGRRIKVQRFRRAE